MPAAATAISLDTTSCAGVGTLFKDGSSVATLISTGVLVSPHAFECIMESAFSKSGRDPTVKLSAAFVGELSRVLSLVYKRCSAKGAFFVIKGWYIDFISEILLNALFSR